MATFVSRGSRGVQGEQGPAGPTGATGAIGPSGSKYTPFDRLNTPPPATADYIGTWPPGATYLPAGYLRHDRFLISIGNAIPKQYRAVAYQVFGACPGSPVAQIDAQVIGSPANSGAPDFDTWSGLATVTWSVNYTTIGGQPVFKYQLDITTTKDPNEVYFQCYGEQGTELVTL